MNGVYSALRPVCHPRFKEIYSVVFCVMLQKNQITKIQAGKSNISVHVLILKAFE